MLMCLSQIPSGNDPFISNPYGKVLPYNLDASEIRLTSPPGMYKKPGNIMEQKLPTSLNLNMVSWTRISGLHQQQQYLDLVSRHLPRSVPSVHEPARRVQSTLGCCFLRMAEEQLFPRWAWKMVPYYTGAVYIIYVYICI